MRDKEAKASMEKEPIDWHKVMSNYLTPREESSSSYRYGMMTPVICHTQNGIANIT